MPYLTSAVLGAALLCFAFLGLKARRADGPLDPAGVEYFERHIRPVFEAQCAECHSDSIQAKGGLRLDIAARCF